MIIRWLNVGTAQTADYRGNQVQSAIFKQPVSGPLYLSKMQFAGDQQADMVHHGGPDKAVCVYPYTHYPYWERELDRMLAPSAFGENLTVEGLTEETVCIGDRYQIGDATVQVAQPRIPCYKLSMKHGVPDLDRRVIDAGYTGFYLRVLTEGHVAPGDRWVLLSRPENAPTIAEVNRVLHHDKENLEAARAQVDAEGLAEVWRTFLHKRIERA